MDRNEELNRLTPEQRACAEKVDALLGDEKNRERLLTMKTADEAIAFFEENGITCTDEQKEEIRKKAGEMAAAAKKQELSPDELQAASGGWSWKGFAGGSILGGGAGAAVALGVIAASNPIGWAALAVTAAAVVGAGVVGTLSGAFGQDE